MNHMVDIHQSMQWVCTITVELLWESLKLCYLLINKTETSFAMYVAFVHLWITVNPYPQYMHSSEHLCKDKYVKD